MPKNCQCNPQGQGPDLRGQDHSSKAKAIQIWLKAKASLKAKPSVKMFDADENRMIGDENRMYGEKTMTIC